MLLRKIRNDFQGHATRMGMESAALFAQQHGATAKFAHIGVDSDRDSHGRRHIHGQVYMVFTTASGMRVPLTPRDVENVMQSVLGLPHQFPGLRDIRTNMGRELMAAAGDMKVWAATLNRLNPHAYPVSVPRREVA